MTQSRPWPVLIVLWIMLSSVSTTAQINDQLRDICAQIHVTNDESDPNYSHVSRSRQYEMGIYDDTLTISVQSIDSLIGSSDPRDVHRTTDIYNIPLKSIGQINYVSMMKESYGYEWMESYIDFIALRDYPLFRKTYKGRSWDTGWITLRVVNHADTIHFKELADILNQYISPDDNYIAPSCLQEEIILNRDSSQKVMAVYEQNLGEPIRLNGQTDLEKELHKLLIPYLRQENIPKLYGSIVIHQDDQFLYFDCEQNDMYNYLNSLDTVPAGFRVMRKTAYFEITDNQRRQIDSILQKQHWTAGQCSNGSVHSYFDFHVANADYQKPDDN